MESYKPSNDSSTPSTLSDADTRRAAIGRPVREQPTPSLAGLRSGPGSSGTTIPGSNLPANGGPAGFGNTGSQQQSMAAGVSGPERIPEYKQPLPVPGITLGLPNDPNATAGAGQQLGFNGTFGSPDFQSPSFNPGLLGRPGQRPGGPGNSARSQSGSGRVSKSGKRRKS